MDIRVFLGSNVAQVRRAGTAISAAQPGRRSAGLASLKKKGHKSKRRPAGVSAFVGICYSFVTGFELIDAFRQSGRERTRPDRRHRRGQQYESKEGTPEGTESLVSVIRAPSRAGGDTVTKCHRGRRPRKLVAACRWKPGPEYL